MSSIERIARRLNKSSEADCHHWHVTVAHSNPLMNWNHPLDDDSDEVLMREEAFAVYTTNAFQRSLHSVGKLNAANLNTRREQPGEAKSAQGPKDAAAQSLDTDQLTIEL